MVKKVILCVFLCLLTVSLVLSFNTGEHRNFSFYSLLNAIEDMPKVEFSLVQSFDNWSESLNFTIDLPDFSLFNNDSDSYAGGGGGFGGGGGGARPKDDAFFSIFTNSSIRLVFIETIWDYAISPILRIVLIFVEFLSQVFVILYYVMRTLAIA